MDVTAAAVAALAHDCGVYGIASRDALESIYPERPDEPILQLMGLLLEGSEDASNYTDLLAQALASYDDPAEALEILEDCRNALAVSLPRRVGECPVCRAVIFKLEADVRPWWRGLCSHFLLAVHDDVGLFEPHDEAAGVDDLSATLVPSRDAIAKVAGEVQIRGRRRVSAEALVRVASQVIQRPGALKRFDVTTEPTEFATELVRCVALDALDAHAHGTMADYGHPGGGERLFWSAQLSLDDLRDILERSLAFVVQSAEI